MTDKFARQTAQQAHRRVSELGQKLARLEKLIARRSMFRNRCHLCGHPCKRGVQYCHAHSWAEGK